jgi:uncharacterized protein (DUF362 family)
MKRRTFLRLGALAVIGFAAGFIYRRTAPLGLLTFSRWQARGLKKRFFGPPSVVALGESSNYDSDLLKNLRNLWGQAEMPNVRAKRILIKPNLIDFLENHPVTTSPEMVGAVADLLLELGAKEIIVGDGSGFRRETWPVAQAIGLDVVLAKRGLKFVDLNYDNPQPIPVQDKWIHRSSELWLPRHVLNADMIVSLPKLKTHHWAGVSLSLKNLFGVVPGARYGWPKNFLHMNGIPKSIIGIHQALPPVVSVVDGIIGMEGDGPLFGTPVHHGLLAVGRDPVSVDVTCARLMGFSLESIPHLKLASWAGIGQAYKIDVRGGVRERLQRYYQPPPFALEG